MPKSIGRKGIIAIVLALIAVIGVASLAFFTDRVDHSMQFTTASFSADGYKLTRTAPEGPFCAGEEVTATLKESNTGDDDVNSIISMKATWVSPDTSLSIFGNANAADNATLSIGGTKVDYTVNAGNKSISFDLPKQVLAAGTKDAARDLTLTIPASFKSTGRIEFTFEKVVVAQEGGGFSKEYSRTDLNAASDLDYSVKVGWAASSIEAQNGKALMGYLTDRNSSGKFGIEFELAFNYTESPMKDFSSRTGAKWSYYKGAVDRLTFVEGMTTIGDYAFPDFSAVKSVSFPTTVKTIGISAFDASGLTGTVTIPATVKEIKSLAFGNLPNVKTFTFGHTTDSLTLPDNTAAGKRNTGAFYVPTHVDTTVNTTVEAIMYGYKWHDGYDNRRLVPTLNAQDTWFRTGSTAKLDEDVLENITFADYHMPVTGETSWDASDPSVPGTVTAFLSADKKSLILAGNGYGLVFANEDSSGAFGNLTALKTVSNTNLLDTRNATTMADMFNFDKKLANISVTTWNVSKVTDMSNMFYCCDSLPSIDLKPNTCTAKDGSGQYTAWNTASLKNTSGMFMDYGGENHALTTVDTTGWDTSKLEDTSYMFMECRGLTAVKGIESWNVSNLKTANNMFQDCQSLQTINVSDWNTASLENTSVMFSSCKALKNIDISKWDMSKVTRSEDASQTMSEAMFAYCESLTELTLPKSLTVVGDRFAAECPKLATITFNHPAGTAVQLGSDAFIVNDNGKDEGATGYVKYTPVAPLGTKVVTSNDQVLGYDWTSDHRGYKVEIKNVEGGTLTGAPLTTYNGQKAVVAINGKTITFTPSNVNAYNGVTIQYSQGGTTKTVTLDKNTMTWTMPAVDDKASEADVVVTPKWVVPVLAEKGTWYKGTTAKSTITEIELVDTYTATGNEAESWDASAAQDGGVKAYINGTKLIIAGNGYGKVLANADSTSAFNAFTNLTSFTGLNKLDTSNVTNMQTMFNNLDNIQTLDLSSFNTSKVTNFYSIFGGNDKLTTLNLTGWDTSAAKDMGQMFYVCNALTTINGLSSFNTANVTDMSGMFHGCKAMTSLDLSNFNTAKVKTLSMMFYQCSNLETVKLTSFDTSNVTSLYAMFQYCYKLKTVDLSSFNTAKVTTMRSIFGSCKAIESLDLSSFDTSAVTNMSAAFDGCQTLQTVTLGKDFKFVGTDGYLPAPSATYISGADGNWYVAGMDTGYTPTELAAVTRVRNVTYSAVKPETVGGLDVGESVFLNVDGKRMEFIVVNQGNPDTSIYDDSCNGTWLLMKDIYEKRQWNSSNVNNLENSTIHSYLNGTFLNLFDSNIKDTIKQVKIPYRKNGGSGGTDQSGANGLSAKIFLLSGYEVGWTTSDESTLPMDGAKLDYFESGTGTYANSKRIANFNGAAANWCLRSPLTGVTGSVWGVYSDGSSTYFSAADSRDGGCGVRPALVLPSTITVDNDRNVGGSTGEGGGDIPADMNLAVPEQVGTLTANGSEQSPTWKNYDSSKMTISGTTSAVEAGTYTATFTLNDGYAWFDGTAEDKDVQWTMESGAPMLAEGSSWYKSSVSRKKFTKIELIDSGTPSGTIVEQWNADVDNSGSIKAYVEGTTLTIAGNGTGKIKANALSWSVFNGFSSATAITGLDLMDTSNALTMEAMFYGCKALTALDVSKFDTSNVTSMRAMFYECENLTSLNVSKFDTAAVTNVEAMFQGCKALTAVGDVSGWNTAKVTSMYQVFYGCEKLAALDLSGWNTINVTNMQAMFLDCTSLTSVGDISGWNTAKVTEMALLFGNCEKLASLDVSKFNTAAVTNMNAMFFNCSALTTLDVSNWNTSNVTTMEATFQSCKKLTTMGDVSGWDTSKVTNMREMFCQCNLITSVDVTNWKTGNVTNMNGIFSNCEKLTSVGDLSGWDTSSATDMGLIFNSCFKLTGMGDISQWDTSNATKMNGLFATCESLTELDLSGWDTSKVTDMNNIFGGYEHEQLEEGEIVGECVLLRKITLGAKFKFVGTDSYLPEPDSRYISGADGKWYAGSTGYTPAELAGLSRTEAVTYVAVKGTKTMSILSGDNAVSGYSISE